MNSEWGMREFEKRHSRPPRWPDWLIGGLLWVLVFANILWLRHCAG